jgi:hypothetical protein
VSWTPAIPSRANRWPRRHASAPVNIPRTVGGPRSHTDHGSDPGSANACGQIKMSTKAVAATHRYPSQLTSYHGAVKRFQLPVSGVEPDLHA